MELGEAVKENACQLEKATPTIVNKISARPKEGRAHCKSPSCHHCGGKHPADKCNFEIATVTTVAKKGHLAKVCRSSTKRNASKSNLPKQQHGPTLLTTSQILKRHPLKTLTTCFIWPTSIPTHGNCKCRQSTGSTYGSRHRSIISNKMYQELSDEERPQLSPLNRKLPKRSLQ